MVQKKDADDLDYSSVLVLTLFASLVVYLVLFFSADYFAVVYKKSLLVPVFRVMGLVLFINSFKSVLLARISSRLEFKLFFVATLIGTVVSAFVGIIMALEGFGAWALVAQYMTNCAIDTLVLSICSKYKPRFNVSKTRLKGLFRFGSKIYLSSIITVLHDEIRPLVVGTKFSTKDLALYTKGESFPQLLNSSVSDTLAAVLFPVMAQVQDDKDEVRNITRRFMSTASFIIFPAMVGLFAVADKFVSVLLTEKWLPIVPYIRIFCLSYMFEFIHIGNLQAIKAIGRSDVVLKLEIIKKSSYMAILVVFILLSNSPMVLALSSIATTIVAYIANSYPNTKLIGYRFSQQISDIFPNLISSIVMGFVVYAVGRIKINSLFLMIIQILIGIVVYVLLSLITKNENFWYLIDIVRDFSGRRKVSQ